MFVTEFVLMELMQSTYEGVCEGVREGERVLVRGPNNAQSRKISHSSRGRDNVTRCEEGERKVGGSRVARGTKVVRSRGGSDQR